MLLDRELSWVIRMEGGGRATHWTNLNHTFAAQTYWILWSISYPWNTGDNVAPIAFWFSGHAVVCLCFVWFRWWKTPYGILEWTLVRMGSTMWHPEAIDGKHIQKYHEWMIVDWNSRGKLGNTHEKIDAFLPCHCRLYCETMWNMYEIDVEACMQESHHRDPSGIWGLRWNNFSRP